MVEDMERKILGFSAAVSGLVPVLSANRQRNITRVTEDKKNSSKTIISTRYVEPFQGCANYNTSYYNETKGFLGSERNYNFIFKVCEVEKGNKYSVEVIDPYVPGQTGYKAIQDINKLKIDESTISYE